MKPGLNYGYLRDLSVQISKKEEFFVLQVVTEAFGFFFKLTFFPIEIFFMADHYPVGLTNSTYVCLIDSGVITEHPNLPLPLYADPIIIANLVDEQEDAQPMVTF